MRMKFKFLEHTADMKFQSFGKTLEEAFENSAYALISIMTKDKVKSKIKKKIYVKGKDKENLLYSFLEEFLFLLDSENWVLSKILSIKIENEEIEAEVVGDNSRNYKFTNDVKAITYNQMFVKQETEGENKGLWVCQVVVDV